MSRRIVSTHRMLSLALCAAGATLVATACTKKSSAPSPTSSGKSVAAPNGAPPAGKHAVDSLPKVNGHPPEAAKMLGQILHDNAAFVRSHPPAYFDRFKDQQHPRATVVACADSRFHTHAIDLAADDDIFMIRNIGNVVDTVGGSVEYGVRHLHTPLLIIIGHVRCGSVKAAMTDYEGESMAIRREVDALHLSLLRTNATGSLDDQWRANVVGNVNQQVRYAMRAFAPELRAGTLSVAGAVYDFRDELKQGPGKVVIVNINGETDRAKLDAHPLYRAAVEFATKPAQARPAPAGSAGH